MFGECWKEIKLREDWFLVSTEGRVARLGTDGKWRLIKFGQAGYSGLTVSRGYKRRKTYSLHRIILETFVGPCPTGKEGCHKNDNPRDNRLFNLRWDTHKSNILDRTNRGTVNKGENHGNSKLTEKDILRIRNLWDEGSLLQKEIALEYDVSVSHVSRILAGINWQHV